MQMVRKNSRKYSYKDDKIHREIVNVLDQYSYHFTTKRALTNSSQMSDSSKPQMTAIFGNKMLVISIQRTFQIIMYTVAMSIL